MGNILYLSFIQPGNPMLEPRSRSMQHFVQEKGGVSKIGDGKGAFLQWPDIVLLNWHDYIHSLIEPERAL